MISGRFSVRSVLAPVFLSKFSECSSAQNLDSETDSEFVQSRDAFKPNLCLRHNAAYTRLFEGTL